MKQGADQRQRGLAAKDPLMQKGHQKVKMHKSNKAAANDSTPRTERVFRLSCLTLGPFCIYVLVLFMTAFMFYREPVAVYLVFISVTGICLLQYVLVQYCVRKKGPRWKAGVGKLGALAALVGLCVGLFIHYKWMLLFAKYSNMKKYTNVAPLQPALQFEDAGRLAFTAGTSIDRTRAVGYRHIRSQTTLCVAPVVSQQMTPTDEIVFFAVGTNCCGWRASFHCGDSSGQSGILMLQADQLVSPSMEWMVDAQFDFPAFEDAIELLKSVFAVSVAKHHRMLRWVKDPSAEIDHYRKRGVEAALISCVVYWVVAAVLIASFLAGEEQKSRQKAKALSDGKSSSMA